MASGGSYPAVADLANQVRRCYRSDPIRAESLIEECLERGLEGVPLAARLSLIRGVLRLFEPSRRGLPAPSQAGNPPTWKTSSPCCSDSGLPAAILGSKDLAQRLAASLNSIFDQLNELVGIINRTFGKETAALETIRHLTGPISSDRLHPTPLPATSVRSRRLFSSPIRRLGRLLPRGRKILAELDPERLADGH